MNLLKCEQYFYLLLSGKEKFRSSEGNPGSREKFLFSSCKDTLDMARVGLVSAHLAGVAAPARRGARVPLPSNHSLVIFDRQPKPFCEENEWTTYEKWMLFKNIHHWKGLIFLSSNNLVPKAPGLPLSCRKEHIGGLLYGVISFVTHSLIHFLFPAPAQGAWLWNQGATKLTHIAVVTLVNYTY